jgi:CheY-like chemotaxis protein
VDSLLTYKERLKLLLGKINLVLRLTRKTNHTVVMATRFNAIATLIVDDSEVECQLLRAQLGQFDWMKVIDCVHDGLEALAYVRRSDPLTGQQAFLYPDLILLDFKMPRCDGMQVLKLLQHQLLRPRIVLWSTALEQIDVPLALELGADLVCSKPHCLAELSGILDRLGMNMVQPRFVMQRLDVKAAEPMPA